MKLHRIFFLCLLGVFVVSWQLIPKIAQAQNSEEQLVEMHTSLGTITLSLSNDTPLHRDNFIKLVQDKAYDYFLQRTRSLILFQTKITQNIKTNY